MQSKQSLNLLTICRKAGKLILGFDASCEAVALGKAYCLLTATDISSKTKKELLFQCGDFPCYTVPAEQMELAGYFGRKTAVMAVCDEGFAQRFAELLNESE